MFNAKTDLFPKIVAKEVYYSACHESHMLRLASKLSYRETESELNELRWQDDDNKIKFRTLADVVERDGGEISNYIDVNANQILKQHEFNPKTGQPAEIATVEKAVMDPQTQRISEYKVRQVLEEYNAEKDTEYQIDEAKIHEVYESVEQSVCTSVDDVLVTQQKESGRTPNPEPKDSKHYVKNTVVHIQQNDQKYVLTGLGIIRMLIVLTAFLLHNNLLANKELIFFTDGADDIKTAILLVFGWRAYRIILDWFHLRKKISERLSMAMKGRELRNNALKKMLLLLWRGNVDGAIEYLRGLDPSTVKNPEQIKKLIDYLLRNRDFIPCYILRKKLGLRNSSNRVEKANDLVVAKRQKNNGTSWSKPGSSGLAIVTSLLKNNEAKNWTSRRRLEFKLMSAPCKKCA